jgi:hypothetical protein
MEPQNNYSMGQGSMQQPVYGRKRSNKGCLTIAVITLLIAGIGSAVIIYFIYNKVNSTVESFTDKFNDMKNQNRFIGNRNVDERFVGNFIDAVPVPSTGTAPKIFILTDASKTYIETKKRPGYYSTGAACIDCKTMAYVYDPITNSIVNSSEFKYPDVVNSTEIALKDNRIYQFTGSYHETPAGVNIYDALTGELVTENKDFITQFPELSSGLTELNYHPEKRYVSFDTKDGRKNILFSLDYGRIFENDREFNKMIESSAEGEGTILAMVNSSNDSRRQIYKITAPNKNIYIHYSTLMDYAGKEEMLKSYQASSEKISDKNYIEGIIYAQDEDYVFLVSLDAAGKKANRIFTCLETKIGKELWSVQQDELFDYMKIDEVQNSSQSLSSTKDKISVSRLGNLVLLKLKGDGIMAFDTDSGKKLWSIQTAPVSF